jgi:hypothetical protein
VSVLVRSMRGAKGAINYAVLGFSVHCADGRLRRWRWLGGQ